LAKRRPPPVEQLSSEVQELFDVLNNERDIAVILIGTSFLDACLASILHRKFIESTISDKLLDLGAGALGSIAPRADLCYVLEFIDKPLYQDLCTISQIRNEVAHHHLALSFGAESVQALCTKLRYVASLQDAGTGQPLSLVDWMIDARSQFVLTTVMASQRLLIVGLGVKRASTTA
jgi:DNA-binding MltR family transcriptional regulator